MGTEKRELKRWFMSPLLLLTAAAEAVSDDAVSEALPSNRIRDYCNYTILIETTCTSGAGTTNPVSLRFADSNSTDVVVYRLHTDPTKRIDERGRSVVPDDVPRVPFRQCSTDSFTVSKRCVTSPTCYLYLKLRGEDDWRPGRVRVQVLVWNSIGLSSNTFYFRRFLPRRVWHGFDNCKG